jgi:hypothetical protein
MSVVFPAPKNPVIIETGILFGRVSGIAICSMFAISKNHLDNDPNK